MDKTKLREIIKEVVLEVMTDLQITESQIKERTIASRKPPRKMTAAQIAKRDRIGKAMKAKAGVVSKYKKKYGESDWESYLWAAAGNAAMRD